LKPVTDIVTFRSHFKERHTASLQKVFPNPLFPSSFKPHPVGASLFYCRHRDCQREVTFGEAKGRDGHERRIHGSVNPSPSARSKLQSNVDLHRQSDAGYSCDHCGTEPILGTRFSCRRCPSLDLCQSCFEKPNDRRGKFDGHGAGHSFDRVDCAAAGSPVLQGQLDIAAASSSSTSKRQRPNSVDLSAPDASLDMNMKVDEHQDEHVMNKRKVSHSSASAAELDQAHSPSPSRWVGEAGGSMLSAEEMAAISVISNF
jgi:hypothetical protein